MLSRYEEPRDGGNYSGLRGEFQGVDEDGVVTVADHIDVLGTWWGARRYTLTGDGAFTFIPAQGELWQRTIDNLDDPENWTGEYGPALETKAELPVTLDGSGETTLPLAQSSSLPQAMKPPPHALRCRMAAPVPLHLHAMRTNGFRASAAWEESEYFVMLPYAG